MCTIDALGPTQRAALLATYRAPNRTLRRSIGGWWLGTGPDGKPASFTIRIVNMLSRAYLIDLEAPFADSAPITRQGVALAEQLLAVEGPKAAA